MERTSYKVSNRRLTKAQFFLPILAFVSLLSFLFYLLNSSRSLWQEDINQHTLEHAISQASLLERNLNRSFSAAYILGSLVQQGQGQLLDFDYTATSLLQSLEGISNLQLAPAGIIEKIYPLAGQEKALGHNILKDDKRLKEAQLAKDKHAMTLAGPFELIQGGVAIIARQPVWLSTKGNIQSKNPGVGDDFWGFSSALIYLDDAIEMS